MDLLHSTILDALNDAAAKKPSELAFAVFDDEQIISITYHELMSKARAIAAAMSSSVRPGDRVVLLYFSGVDFIEAFFACMYAQVIAIPVSPPQHSELISNLHRINESTTPALWLSTTEILDKLKKLQTGKRPVLDKIATIFGGDKSLNESIVISSELEKLPWFTTDKIDTAEAVRYKSPVIDPNTVAILQYTSGALGHPKGVLLTHGNIAHNLEMNRLDTELNAKDVCVSWLPPFHNVGLITSILQPIYSHIPVYLMPSRAFLEHPIRWLQAISKYKATISGAPDFAYQMCLSTIKPDEKTSLDLNSWEIAFCGGESVRPSTLESFYQAFRSCGVRREIFYPAYGLTESTVYALGSKRNMGAHIKYVDRDALSLQKITPVTPYVATAQTVISYFNNPAFQQVQIINPDTLKECEEGELGEIWLKSPSVAAGYWQEPEETKRTFQNFINEEGPFLRTGDLGYKLQDNQVVVIGKRKELILIDGKNYYAQDIEFSVGRSHSDLTPGSVAALGVEKHGREQLLIIAEVDEITGERANAIFSTIRRRIMDNHGIRVQSIYLTPRQVLKKTIGGKVRRYDIRKRYLDNKLEILYQWAEKITPEKVETFKPRAEKSVVTIIHPVVITPELSISDTITRAEDQKLPEQVSEDAFITPDTGLIPQALPVVETPKRQESTPSSYVEIIRPEPAPHSQEISISNEPETSEELQPIQIQEQTLHFEQDAYRQEEKPLMKEEVPVIHADLKNHDIAIIGYSCRFPGGINSPEQLWQVLIEHTDVISGVPLQRWNKEEQAAKKQYFDKLANQRGGFIADVDQFDGEFFGIDAHELKYIDPQQRLLLEVAWEALERSGIAPCSLRGTNAAVYIGISDNDYATLIHDNESINTDVSIPSANALSMAAGRLSFFLGLEGPCLSVDTACSSALTSIHLAIGALRREECNLALSGSVNLILTPEHSIHLSQAGMLSPEGNCKSFDSQANGFTRSEGCGLFVLKRLEDALLDNDNILGVIKGSALNRDGASTVLSAPGIPGQKALIAKTLQDAHLKALDIDYIEAHGIGNLVADSTEVKALRVLGHKRNQPLLIGAIKSNLGHTEAASGAAGIMKVLLSFEHDCIPANLHFFQINSDIHLEELPAKIVVENTPWPKTANRLRRAGVSSFGFSGTNAHLVLEEALNTNTLVANNDGVYQLFTLSAKTRDGLMALIHNYQIFLSETSLSLPEIAYTASVGRSHFACRLALVALNTQDLLAKLQRCDYQQEVARSQNNTIANNQLNALIDKLVRIKGFSQDYAVHLQILANSYMQGGDVDWSALYESKLKKVVLPTYCFQRQSYWLSERTNSVEQVSEATSDALKIKDSEFNQPQLCYYEMIGTPKSLVPPTGDKNSEVWLFFSGEEGLARSIQQQVAAKNIHVIEAFFGRDFNPKDKSHLLAILNGHQKVNKIIYSPGCWQKNKCEHEAHDIDTVVPEVIEKNMLNLLVFLQALCQVNFLSNPFIFFITNGDYPFASNEISFTQSASIGLFKTFILEQPQLTCRHVDLDFATSITEKVRLLSDEILSDTQESHAVYRQNNRYVARFINQDPSIDASCVLLNPHGSYLITSLSTVSLQVAEWLVKQGARHIVLVDQQEPSLEKRNVIKMMREKAILEVKYVDISVIEQTQQLIGHFNNNWPPLCGVIHTADSEQNSNSLPGVFKSKVHGTWNLHTACIENQIILDFFILFSSIDSVLGAPGQSSYAAANSFLDSFALYRQSLMLPALSVNWGPWANNTDGLNVSHQDCAFIPLSQQEVFCVLAKALVTSKAQLICSRINWPQYLQKIPKIPSWLDDVNTIQNHESCESPDSISNADNADLDLSEEELDALLRRQGS